MDSRGIPADMCPLCSQRALSWEGTVCACLSCGSVFEFDTLTRRCRYTNVAAPYQAAEIALTIDWLSRRDVFELAATLAPVVRPMPVNHLSGAPVIGATLTPVKMMMVVFVGIVALIPILCACLAIVLLAPGMAQTRQLIAAANTAKVEGTQPISIDNVISVTHVAALSLTQIPTDSRALTSGPLAQNSATPAIHTMANQSPTPIVAPVSPLKSPLGTPAAPGLKPGVTSSVATPTSPNSPGAIPAKLTATPILPATFTAVPTQPIEVGTSMPNLTATQSVTQTSTPNPADVLTATSTLMPSPTPTPNGTPSVFISGSVAISTVMYAGTPELNMSDQFIEVQNRGTNSVNISTWRIHAVGAKLDFYFTNGLVLSSGQTCRIYSGSPPANAGICGSFSFNSQTPVWSTVSDTAGLYDEKGVLIGSYFYSVPR